MLFRSDRWREREGEREREMERERGTEGERDGEREMERERLRERVIEQREMESKRGERSKGVERNSEKKTPTMFSFGVQGRTQVCVHVCVCPCVCLRGILNRII